MGSLLDESCMWRTFLLWRVRWATSSVQVVENWRSWCYIALKPLCIPALSQRWKWHEGLWQNFDILWAGHDNRLEFLVACQIGCCQASVKILNETVKENTGQLKARQNCSLSGCHSCCTSKSYEIRAFAGSNSSAALIALCSAVLRDPPALPHQSRFHTGWLKNNCNKITFSPSKAQIINDSAHS